MKSIFSIVLLLSGIIMATESEPIQAAVQTGREAEAKAIKKETDTKAKAVRIIYGTNIGVPDVPRRTYVQDNKNTTIPRSLQDLQAALGLPPMSRIEAIKAQEEPKPLKSSQEMTSIQTNGTIAAAAKYFAKLFTELDALKAKDKALEANISLLIPESKNDELDSLKAKVSTLTSDVATLESKNAALAKKIEDLPSSGDVRLVNNEGTKVFSTSGVAQGRLEVFYMGEWGTVCDDGDGKDGSSSVQENNNMATVVCRMLDMGYRGNYRGTVYNKAGMGEGTGRIWLDEVRCTGSERRLFDCPHSGISLHNCEHDEDVGIAC